MLINGLPWVDARRPLAAEDAEHAESEEEAGAEESGSDRGQGDGDQLSSRVVDQMWAVQTRWIDSVIGWAIDRILDLRSRT